MSSRSMRMFISGGIPDEAFKPIEGDDKKLTSAYKKRNREERKAWEWAAVLHVERPPAGVRETA